MDIDYKRETEILKLVFTGKLGCGDSVWIHSYREFMWDAKEQKNYLSQYITGYYVTRLYQDGDNTAMTHHEEFNDAIKHFEGFLLEENFLQA